MYQKDDVADLMPEHFADKWEMKGEEGSAYQLGTSHLDFFVQPFPNLWSKMRQEVNLQRSLL